MVTSLVILGLVCGNSMLVNLRISTVSTLFQCSCTTDFWPQMFR